MTQVDNTVRRTLGPACLYGQVIKTRMNDRIIKVERRTLIGDTWRFEETLRDSEDSSKLNSSFVERLNLTISLSFSADDLPRAMEGASRRSPGDEDAEFADLLLAVNGSGKCVVRSYPAHRKKIDIGDYYADFSHIRSALGWEPRVLLWDGLARTLAFYRENLEHYF
jgi:hypothetical protein